MRHKSTFIWHILAEHVYKSTHLLGLLLQLRIACKYLCVMFDMPFIAFDSKLLHIKVVSQTCNNKSLSNCCTVLSPDRNMCLLPPE